MAGRTDTVFPARRRQPAPPAHSARGHSATTRLPARSIR
ncbi:hypothetical protein A33M_1802 [Rhodovulum sp. PH10]|nr:hypothetical protein A33M_1802 [Rhodovulum sp. PH10]